MNLSNILIIDDDPAVRGALRLILEEDGFIVRDADNGLLGIEMVQAERPSLIFLDLRMPGIDGVETLRRLKKIDPTLTIYIVTAFASEYMDQLKQAHSEGLDFQLASKPLSSSQIRHIARAANQLSDVAKESIKIVLTLYVVSQNNEVKKLLEQLSTVLSATYDAGSWVLDVIEVLAMPEKALEHEVYATPMLVRNLPEPILRLLGDLSKMPLIFAAITTNNSGESGTVIL